MNNSRKLLMFFIILLISMVSSYAEKCIDTDNGKDFETYGEVTSYFYDDGPVTYSDACDGRNVLAERICDTDGGIATIAFHCDELGENWICQEGRCIDYDVIPFTENEMGSPTARLIDQYRKTHNYKLFLGEKKEIYGNSIELTNINNGKISLRINKNVVEWQMRKDYEKLVVKDGICIWTTLLSYMAVPSYRLNGEESNNNFVELIIFELCNEKNNLSCSGNDVILTKIDKYCRSTQENVKTCSNGEYCLEGNCIEYQCLNNNDCESWQECIDHECKSKTNNSIAFETKTKEKNNSKINFYLILITVLIFFSILLIILFWRFNSKKKNKSKNFTNTNEVLNQDKASDGIAVEVKSLLVKHGKKVILDNIDFSVRESELVSLLGPSGIGKSTIIESIVGRKIPASGEIKIFGVNISKKDVYNKVGFVPQHAELYLNQTVEQNLVSSATKWGVKDINNKVEKILYLVNLGERREIKANKLSGGQLKLLSLGMELLRDPDILILDEPTTGLDPNTRDNIITILSKIVTRKNKTVFFTTHFMEDTEECDNVIILANKKIIAEGPPPKLKKRIPGNGKIVNLKLDNVTDNLINQIEGIDGIIKVISEGRKLKIISEDPNAVKIAQKIDEIGGTVNKTEITNATMKEVFVYFTGTLE